MIPDSPRKGKGKMLKHDHGAFILARYSTDNQNPDSIEVQVSKCTDWCHQKNLPILGIFADYATSGMKDTRPQYEAMMQQLRQALAGAGRHRCDLRSKQDVPKNDSLVFLPG